MQLLRFIPIQLTLALILGIIFGNYTSFGTIAPMVGSVPLLILLGLLLHRDFGKGASIFALTTVLLTFCIGVLAISLSNPNNLPNHYANSITGRSQSFHLKITEVLKPSSFSKRYIAELKSVNDQSTSGKLLLSLQTDTLGSSYQVDEELVLRSRLNTIKPPLNPHQFDYKSYMKDLGIAHQIRISAGEVVTLPNAQKTIYGRAAALRQHIISKLKKADFGEAELSVIQALLLGQRHDISAETYNDYKNAGAVHILAVSGLHIGILLLLLQLLLKPLELLPKGKTIKLLVIVVLLWGFALLAGFSASIVRAVSMFSFVAYAMYLNRPSNTFNILALSMLFTLLVIYPKLLFQVGFQMSYAAVFAIVWIYPLLQKLWYPKNTILRKIWQLLSVSVAAQVGVLPISLFYFHQFPGLFFISNLIVVPALGIILGMGILVLLLAVFNWLPDFIVNIYDTLIRWMNNLIAWVAEQEAFVFQNISFDAAQLVLAYVVLIGIIVFLSKPSFKKALILAIAILGSQGYLFYSAYQTKTQDRLVVLHQTANSVLLQQSGPNVVVFSQDSSKTERMVTDYQVTERISSIRHQSISNSYQWKNKTVLVVDSTGVYPTKKPVDYLLLTQSPKVNLERIIDALQPRNVIADGSNYRSYTERWRRTCAKRKLPFHNTGEKGAYYLASSGTTKK